MKLCAEYPSDRRFAPSKDPGGPAADGELVAVVRVLQPESSAASEEVASRWSGNLLNLTADLVAALAQSRLIVNTGSIAERLDERDPRNWMAGGMQALTSHVESLDPSLRTSGTVLLLEPHSRHLLHDAQTADVFFREHRRPSLGLALNPSALFEPSMLDCADDHLQRISEALAPLADVLILQDVRLDADQEQLIPCLLGEGLLTARTILSRCVALLRPDTPVILRQPGGATISRSAVEAIELPRD